ncbi:MAG: hypothetical protein IJB74_01900 [Clostridia bacterium]|nr:hypothetical protein [Clostridia bacterium]
MAAKCPNCGKELKFYNIKAECPGCGVSIPNYNWEARLEEDSRIAEEKFAALYRTLNRFKFSVIGSRIRVARLVMSLIPAIGFILPWATVLSEKSTLSFDLLGLFTDGESTISFFGILFKNVGSIFETMSAEGFSGPVSFIMLGFLLVLLSIVAIVVAFFLPFICFKKSDTNSGWVADALSIAFAAAGAVMFILSASKVNGASFSIGTLDFAGASLKVLWGVFVYIALLAVAMTGNILVSKAPVESDEALEAVRAEKLRLKEEKEEAERIKKEAAWAEAKKKAEQEQAEKVRKAREALAAKENKK